jgi:hypothetical protein
MWLVGDENLSNVVEGCYCAAFSRAAAVRGRLMLS